MKFCPKCGNTVDPDKKFCTSCGASLTPDLPVRDSETLPIPASESVTTAGSRHTGALIAAAALVLVILVVVFIGYPALTGSSILSAAGVSQSSQPTPVATGSSWVEVLTEEPTPATTTETPFVTLSPTTLTTSPTKPQVTKALICSSDTIPCNSSCVNLRTDSSNCGYCGTACPSGNFCLNGQCMKSCSASQTSCPGGCFDLQSDRDHCGTCLNDCPRGLICSRGQCTAPATPEPVPL